MRTKEAMTVYHAFYLCSTSAVRDSHEGVHLVSQNASKSRCEGEYDY